MSFHYLSGKENNRLKYGQNKITAQKLVSKCIVKNVITFREQKPQSFVFQ